MIAWSDAEGHLIHICRLPHNAAFLDGISACGQPEAKVLIEHVWGAVDGLAIDWVHALLFYVVSPFENRASHIVVVDLRTLQVRVLIDDGVKNPSAIAVDPLFGIIFWTDTSYGAGRIER